jgi:hypothetical protein
MQGHNEFWLTFPISQWFPAWTGALRSGDSGHPIYVLVKNELVLAATWFTGTASGGGGPWYGYTISDVNAAITALDTEVLGGPTGYQATPMNMDEFINY